MKNKKIDFRNSFFDEMYKISKKIKNCFFTADISAYSFQNLEKFPTSFTT